MTESEFVTLVRRNPINREILDRLPRLGVPDAWLVSGSLFQTIWNCLCGNPESFGIKDYDLFYFDDSDISWKAEDEIIAKAKHLFHDLDGSVEVRNQARVHLWYPKKFGMAYPPLRSTTEGIDRFLAKACQVGIRQDSRGDVTVYAPNGLDDIKRMIIRPNACANFVPNVYESKTTRWKALWPTITIVPHQPAQPHTPEPAESPNTVTTGERASPTPQASHLELRWPDS